MDNEKAEPHSDPQTDEAPRRMFKREAKPNGGSSSAIIAKAVISNGHTSEDMASTEELALQYTGIVPDASAMGYWVDVPIPMYRGMAVLYRTSNATRVRRIRPPFITPPTLEALRMEVNHAKAESARLTELQRTDFEEDRQAALESVLQRELDKTLQLVDMESESVDEYHRATCRWLANFVIDINPWPFKDVKKPTQSEPESFVVLYEEFEDLYHWMVNKGYTAALAESAKNF